MNIFDLFNINTVFFTVFGYQMSYLEFFGTILNLTCVWLVARKNIWNWPVGILAVILFGFLFYQLQLYADLFEQGYYLLTGFWGWYAWASVKKPDDARQDIVVKRNSIGANVAWLGGIVVLTALGTWAMTRIHVWLPKLFPEPASLPFLDVFTTITSFAAQILLILKRLENWVLWIIVDVIAIGLYWYKEVPLVAMLYAVFLVLATTGLINWHKTYRRENNEDARTSNRQVLPTA